MSKTCPFCPNSPTHHQLYISSKAIFTIFFCSSNKPCKPLVIKILSQAFILKFAVKLALNHWPENTTTPLKSLNHSSSMNVEVWLSPGNISVIWNGLNVKSEQLIGKISQLRSSIIPFTVEPMSVIVSVVWDTFHGLPTYPDKTYSGLIL